MIISVVWSCTSTKNAPVTKVEKTEVKPTKPKVKKVEPVKPYIPELDTAIVHQEIVRLASDSILLNEFTVTSSTLLDTLYDTLQYARVWDEKSLPEALIQLKNCKLDGLYAKDYDVELLDSLFLLPSNTDSSLSIKMARLDVLMTNSYLKYGAHLVEGKTDPYHLDSNWNYSRRSFSTTEIESLLKAGKKGKPEEFVTHCRPNNWYYTSLIKWMERSYDSSYAFLDTLNLKYPGKAIKKGDSSDVIRRLKYRLKDFHSFSGAHPSGFFDDSLEVALKEFQKYRGLVTDGVAGKSSFAALEMTVEEQQDQIRVNMERARWLLHDLPKEFLLVNIAAYQLYIFRNEKVEYQSNVVVGKLHHETPIFHSTIKYIQFNCTWTVPRNIAVDEILPHIQRDGNYLRTRHFDVLNSSGDF